MTNNDGKKENIKIAIDSDANLYQIDTPSKVDTYYIGDDGKPYYNITDLEQANKTYWDNLTQKKDLSHLRALDGSYHSNPESIKEANKRFRETYAEQRNNINLKRNELLRQLLENPKYALNCAGLNFVKQIYQIDPQIIQGLLELMLDSTRTGDFENLESKFIEMLLIQAALKQNNEKIR